MDEVEKKRRRKIRNRDRHWCEYHHLLKDGDTIHHLYYSDIFDRESFVIISSNEHSEIHGHGVCGKRGDFDRNKYHEEYREQHKKHHAEYCKKYYEEHREEIKRKAREAYYAKKNRKE